MIGLSSISYMKNVFLNVLAVALLSAILPCMLFYYMNETVLSFMTISLVAILCTLIVEFYIGCNQKERTFVLNKIKDIKHKISAK